MPDTKHPLKVFLSHAHSDQNVVRELYFRLKGDGVVAWLDKEDIVGGQNFEREIRKAVEESDVVLVCLSKEFNQAGFRQREVKWALDAAMNQPEGDIFIIPLRLEECETLDSLRDLHWVDYFEEDGYERLMRALRLRADNIGAVLQTKKAGRSGLTLPTNKPSKQKPKPVITQKPPQKWNMRIIAAITGIVIIIMAIFGLPWRQWFAPTPDLITATPTNTVTLTPVPPTPTKTPIKFFTPIPTALLSKGFVDSKGVDMLLVPAGKFIMGSASGASNETPVHSVYLDAFYVDKYEVTNTLYKTCVQEGVCQSPKNTDRYDNPVYGNHPVVYVDWNQAQNYCEWRGASLPTEAQWEKAARGTDGLTYPWGEGVDCEKANYSGCEGDTAPVGSYAKNPYGIYDLAGNVWEWVSSLYKPYPYVSNDGREDLNVSGNRVLRGGSWYYHSVVRSAYRSDYPPDLDLSDIGFRCARLP